MKKGHSEKSQSMQTVYEDLDELKASCPSGTTLSGPVDKNGQTITVNGQIEAVCLTIEGVKNGLFMQWYNNGKKAVRGSFTQGKKSGEWTYWSSDGHMTGKGTFNNNKPDGKWITWFKNSKKESEGEYKNGVEEGRFIYWDENGDISKILNYENGKLIKTVYFENGKQIN
ncbi:toxin-antitoxin system YwqK family antitoxin [Ferruginibacter profundus]